MSDQEVRQVEDRTTNLTSRRAFLRTGLALGAGALSAGLRTGKDRVVATPKIATGVILPTVAPLGLNRALVYYCRLAGLDSVLLNDHFQAFIPTAIWDEDFSWRATPGSSFHTFFDYQTLLGYLASSAGRMSVGIGVTEPIRRHPVLIAQAMLTLSHMAKRPRSLVSGPASART